MASLRVPGFYLGLWLSFSRYWDCRCCCWSLGFCFSSPWAGSWCCCWGLEFQFATIQVCGWVLGFHLLVLQPSCSRTLLPFVSRYWKKNQPAEVGFIWIKLFFFLRVKLNSFDLCSGSATVLSEGPFLLRTKIMWFCQKNNNTPFSSLSCQQIGDLNMNVNFGGKAVFFSEKRHENKSSHSGLMSENESCCRIIPSALLLERRTAL